MLQDIQDFGISENQFREKLKFEPIYYFHEIQNFIFERSEILYRDQMI